MIPKFRAYDQKWHEWLIDIYVGFGGKLYQKNKDTVYGTAVSLVNSNNVILMQSTGLVDKNGQEIFEGDVVRMSSGELLPVKIHRGMFEPVCFYVSSAFELVGNVFENPELLEDPDFRGGYDDTI